MTARALAVRVGKPRPLTTGGRTALTAFWKTAASAPVAVSATGLAGDEQADRNVHGGPDKAVCAYPVEHYPQWEQLLGRRLPPGAFGENLPTLGLLEPDVMLGDVYGVGTAVLQVSMPRRPCYKLALAHDRRELPLLVQSSGRTGFYLSVLEPGEVCAGDRMRLLSRPPSPLSVFEVNRVVNVDKHDLDAARTLVDDTRVPARWRQALSRRLASGQQDDDAPRLFGLP